MEVFPGASRYATPTINTILELKRQKFGKMCRGTLEGADPMRFDEPLTNNFRQCPPAWFSPEMEEIGREQGIYTERLEEKKAFLSSTKVWISSTGYLASEENVVIKFLVAHGQTSKACLIGTSIADELLHIYVEAVEYLNSTYQAFRNEALTADSNFRLWQIKILHFVKVQKWIKIHRASLFVAHIVEYETRSNFARQKAIGKYADPAWAASDAIYEDVARKMTIGLKTLLDTMEPRVMDTLHKINAYTRATPSNPGSPIATPADVPPTTTPANVQPTQLNASAPIFVPRVQAISPWSTNPVQRYQAPINPALPFAPLGTPVNPALPSAPPEISANPGLPPTPLETSVNPGLPSAPLERPVNELPSTRPKTLVNQLLLTPPATPVLRVSAESNEAAAPVTPTQQENAEDSTMQNNTSGGKKTVVQVSQAEENALPVGAKVYRKATFVEDYLKAARVPRVDAAVKINVAMTDNSTVKNNAAEVDDSIEALKNLVPVKFKKRAKRRGA